MLFCIVPRKKIINFHQVRAFTDVPHRIVHFWLLRIWHPLSIWSFICKTQNKSQVDFHDYFWSSSAKKLQINCLTKIRESNMFTKDVDFTFIWFESDEMIYEKTQNRVLKFKNFYVKSIYAILNCQKLSFS